MFFPHTAGFGSKRIWHCDDLFDGRQKPNRAKDGSRILFWGKHSAQLWIHKIDERARATVEALRDNVAASERETLCLNASFWRRFRAAARLCGCFTTSFRAI
jgi:hypothetical protein